MTSTVVPNIFAMRADLQRDPRLSLSSQPQPGPLPPNMAPPTVGGPMPPQMRPMAPTFEQPMPGPLPPNMAPPMIGPGGPGAPMPPQMAPPGVVPPNLDLWRGRMPGPAIAPRTGMLPPQGPPQMQPPASMQNIFARRALQY